MLLWKQIFHISWWGALRGWMGKCEIADVPELNRYWQIQPTWDCSTRVHPRFHTCPSSPSMHPIKRCERFVSKGASTISMLVYQRAHTIAGPSTHPIWKENISRIATAKQLIFLHLHNLHMPNREVRSLRSAVYLSIIYIWRPTPAPNSSPSIVYARGMVMAAPGLTGAFYLH
jgi:hypothetical protein